MDDTIMEEREELMVPPTGGHPTLRAARFLKPSVTSVHGPIFHIPSHSISSSTTNSKKRPLKASFNGWRIPHKDWKNWVDRMQTLHQPLWKKAGIHDAVLNSTFTVQRNNNLVLGFAEKWCPETKTFVFPWGESTITLEDTMILGGYSVLGCSVLSSLNTLEMEVEQKLIKARLEVTRTKAKKASHATWLSKFMGTGDEIEHEAFLAYWLSLFVFPASPYKTILKSVLPIAVRLAGGTKIALAPAILASIYRDLSLLKEGIVASNKPSRSTESSEEDDDDGVSAVTVWAPLLLLQVWIWERFPTMRPKPNSTQDGLPRLARWDMLKKANLENVRLAIDSALSHFQWRPYALASNGSLSYKFYKEEEEWVSVDSCLSEELESLAICLRASELVGLECIEQYLPHRVAMQFGMDQDLPGYVARSNATPEIAWRNYKRPFGGAKLYFPPRLFKADVTTRYLEWWKQSVLVGKEESCFKSSKRTMEQSSNGKKADNDALVPPGFPPKWIKVEERDSVDEDKQTVAENIRNSRTKNSKPLTRDPLQSQSSSAADNRTVKNTVQSEPAIGESEKDVGDVTESAGGSSTLHRGETRRMELEARISKLEKVVAQLKAAN